MNQVRSEDSPLYAVEKSTYPLAASEDEIIAKALTILESRVCNTAMLSPQNVQDWFRLRSAHLEHEVFSVMFLDAQHCLIECEDMFRGTATQCGVYAREIAKRALQLNASAVVVSHNHPSGSSEPSQADVKLTVSLKNALAMIDVRVLDHIVVANGGTFSFSATGVL
jgi:DNA repair protein RadC